MFPSYMPTQNSIYNSTANPYAGMNSYSPYQQQEKQEITKVNGEGGAKAYQMPPNSSALLLDETGPIVWLKTTDGAGYPNLIPYSITPFQPEPQPDFKSLEQRISKLEVMLDERNKSYSSGPRHIDTKQSTKPD